MKKIISILIIVLYTQFSWANLNYAFKATKVKRISENAFQFDLQFINLEANGKNIEGLQAAFNLDFDSQLNSFKIKAIPSIEIERKGGLKTSFLNERKQFIILTKPWNTNPLHLQNELNIGTIVIESNNAISDEVIKSIAWNEGTPTQLKSVVLAKENGKRTNLANMKNHSIEFEYSKLAKLNQFEIKPYTQNEKIHILLNQPLNEQVEVSIYDISGKMLVSKKMNINSNHISIDKPILSAGIYVVGFRSNSSTSFEKVLIE